MKNHKLLVTIREVRTYGVTIRAASEADALLRLQARVEKTPNLDINRFSPRHLVSRAITSVRNDK